ncbi:MAG: hypothetical protein A3C56_06520 [Ignavibacteria bacterium RIFCSPHIGHO2_02_FULL_56_12]|nr:MAG: hypothetical protein A3C56_06520 [Ignavibacteria bacterium RIFCSPHIGHO2_02_FULL_56_12]
MLKSTKLAAAATVLFAVADTCTAQVKMTKEEALETYFPAAQIERATAFLTDDQVHEIQQRSRSRVESHVLTYYMARKDGRFVGTAFFETQTVRTMPATYMVIVDPDTTIRAVEVMAFFEPEDYLPQSKWLGQFAAKGPADDLWLKRGIQNISGASLTAQALTEGVRRLLASYQIVVAPKVRS